MKKAIPIVAIIGVFVFLTGGWILALGRQLNWQSALVTGAYICIVSVGILLLAGVLKGVDWISKNVRIQ